VKKRRDKAEILNPDNWSHPTLAETERERDAANASLAKQFGALYERKASAPAQSPKGEL
jgi:hypothetical protein